MSADDAQLCSVIQRWAARGGERNVVVPKLVIVVMGVAGCGKSTVSSVLSRMLETCEIPSSPPSLLAGRNLVEADDYHSAESKAKMAQGIPLSDENRLPWLDVVRHAALTTRTPVTVVACSALRRVYRSRLRGAGPTVTLFAHLSLTFDEAVERLLRRRGHFAGPGLAASQFAVLEALDPAELGVTIDASQPPQSAARAILQYVAAQILRGGALDFIKTPGPPPTAASRRTARPPAAASAEIVEKIMEAFASDRTTAVARSSSVPMPNADALPRRIRETHRRFRHPFPGVVDRDLEVMLERMVHLEQATRLSHARACVVALVRDAAAFFDQGLLPPTSAYAAVRLEAREETSRTALIKPYLEETTTLFVQCVCEGECRHRADVEMMQERLRTLHLETEEAAARTLLAVRWGREVTRRLRLANSARNRATLRKEMLLLDQQQQQATEQSPDVGAVPTVLPLPPNVARERMQRRFALCRINTPTASCETPVNALHRIVLLDVPISPLAMMGQSEDYAYHGYEACVFLLKCTTKHRSPLAMSWRFGNDAADVRVLADGSDAVPDEGRFDVWDVNDAVHIMRNAAVSHVMMSAAGSGDSSSDGGLLTSWSRLCHAVAAAWVASFGTFDDDTDDGLASLHSVLQHRHVLAAARDSSHFFSTEDAILSYSDFLAAFASALGRLLVVLRDIACRLCRGPFHLLRAVFGVHRALCRALALEQQLPSGGAILPVRAFAETCSVRAAMLKQNTTVKTLAARVAWLDHNVLCRLLKRPLCDVPSDSLSKTIISALDADSLAPKCHAMPHLAATDLYEALFCSIAESKDKDCPFASLEDALACLVDDVLWYPWCESDLLEYSQSEAGDVGVRPLFLRRTSLRRIISTDAAAWSDASTLFAMACAAVVEACRGDVSRRSMPTRMPEDALVRAGQLAFGLLGDEDYSLQMMSDSQPPAVERACALLERSLDLLHLRRDPEDAHLTHFALVREYALSLSCVGLIRLLVHPVLVELALLSTAHINLDPAPEMAAERHRDALSLEILHPTLGAVAKFLLSLHHIQSTVPHCPFTVTRSHLGLGGANVPPLRLR